MVSVYAILGILVGVGMLCVVVVAYELGQNNVVQPAESIILSTGSSSTTLSTLSPGGGASITWQEVEVVVGVAGIILIGLGLGLWLMSRNGS